MERATVSAGRLSAAPASASVAGIPLFHAACLFAAGITCTSILWLNPGTLLVSLFILGAACGTAAFRAQRLAWLPMALLWILLGAWCAEMEPHPAPAAQLRAFSDGLLREVEGDVTRAGPVRGEREENVDESADDEITQRIDVRLQSIEMVNDDTDSQVPVEGSVRLTVRWPKMQQPAPLPCGERIRAIVRLLPP